MASRSRQSRRTPQSSSGTITSQETTSARPSINSVNEHARSSSGLANPHFSNTSLPPFPYTRADSPNDRIVKNLVDKLQAKVSLAFFVRSNFFSSLSTTCFYSYHTIPGVDYPI